MLIMKTKNYSILALLAFLFFASCKKDDDTGTITINPDPEPTEPVFIEADPNINDGTITFEETGPSFSEENENNETNTAGTWGRFGEVGDTKISIAYADNPDKAGANDSDKVVQITEPVGVQSWAGFFFNLEETVNFPSGKEAISVHFYSPSAGHNVLLKLEDQLENGTEGKKSTGDLFAVTEGTGWETLVFNIPEKDGERSGIYNRITMILGYGITNEAEAKYYIDNIDFATPKEVVVASAPTTIPAVPTYEESEVISIFSDAYTSPEGINLNPNWGQSTVVTEETIADNTVLKYENLNYQGTEINPAIDISGKTKLHLDYFTGDATTLKFFLISPDSNGDNVNEEKAYELDVTTNPGEWNSIDIDLSHFSDVVDLSDIFQLKVEGNGTVYFDNIFFFGGGAQSGSNFAPQYTGPFGGVGTPVDNVFTYGSTGTESWAGWANEASGANLSFPYGGKITFTASAASAADLYFKFEKAPFPDVDPSFSSANVTVNGDATEYTVYLQPQPAANSYTSLLLYLVTKDVAVTITDIVITAFDALPTGTNFAPAYTGSFGGVGAPADSVFTYGSEGTESWAGWANEASGANLSFPNGGRVTFTASAASAAELYFKFEKAVFPDVDPNFSSANVTVNGDAMEYTVYLQPQPAANAYSSLLFYLITKDVAVTMTDVVITAF